MASALEYELQMKKLVDQSNERNIDEKPTNTKSDGLSFLKKSWTPVEILTTCVMFFEMIGWGLYHGLFGPTLIDLQSLTNTTTTEIGFVFTAITIGGLVGAVVGGQILNRINCRLYMAIMLLLFGAMVIVFPWATNFKCLMAFSVLIGIIQGALDCGKNTTALMLWGWDGAILMQAYHCVFAIGTFISPWIAAPFLLPDQPKTPNITDIPVPEIFTETNYTQKVEETDTSKVHFAYLIVGVYYMVSSMAFSLTYLLWVKFEELKGKGFKNVPINLGKNVEPNSESSCKKETLWYRVPMMILMFIRFGTYVGLEIAYASFLMSFAVKGLGWTKRDGIAVTSVFRASFAAARGLSIFLAAVVTPTKMVLKDILILISAFLVLLFCVESHDLVLWVASGVVGFGMGSIYASSMSWLDGQMVVTTRAGTTIVTGTWMGCLVVPASVGYLFDKVGPMSYVYFCFGDTLFLGLVCAGTMVLAWAYHKRVSKSRKSKRILSTKL